MTQHASPRNPFMLMLNPEVVLAAIEKSERLGQLNRHMCRPLDRAAGTPSMSGDEAHGLVEDAEPDAATDIPASVP
jgi:hypothetical protein